MKQHLNTLFLTTDGSYLAREGQSLLVRVERQTKLRVPVHTLGSVVCLCRALVSPSAMGLCAESGVSISFLTSNGRFVARVSGFTPGNVLLRREQYRVADDASRAALIVRSIVSAKIANQRAVLLRGQRERPNAPPTVHPSDEGQPAAPPDPRPQRLDRAVRDLAECLRHAGRASSIDELRGVEGEAAATYIGVLDLLVTEAHGPQHRAAFSIASRSRRPPMDPANALLSFLYAMLANDCRSACESVGLDPAVGFLHVDRPGRPSLALDLMEEFRPLLADRLALSMINRRQLDPESFLKAESGAVSLTDPARKSVLIAYQKRKQEQLLHPFLGERVTLGLLPHLQALLLARHLRGDLDGYPPFFWK
jgi:CRISPR-associated protein Cas1